MIHRKASKNDEILLTYLSNKLASYHQVIRDNFNYGDNRYYLDFNNPNWLFDPNVKPIYHMNRDNKINWFSSINPFSVFVASEDINPLSIDHYIQRTGVCLIESAEIKSLTNKNKNISEKQAIEIINSYPSESQILGVKPIMGSETIVFLEDNFFEEFWDKFTNGKYSHSKSMQMAFKEQIKRTKFIIKKYVKLMHPKDTPEIRFIKYSEIFDRLQNGVNAWIGTLLEETPYEKSNEEEFYTPNAAFVLYSYGGKDLARISGFDEDKKIVLTRQLSHCVLGKVWNKNKSKVMDWFRDAITNYYQKNPRLMVGYLDLFDNQTSCSYKDTPLEEKVSFGNRQKQMLEESINKQFPLWENKLFQRGVVCDFDPEVLDSMLRIGLINSSYVYPGRLKEQKSQVKEVIKKGLERIYEKYSELILPLFE